MTSFEVYLKGEKKVRLIHFFYILVMLYQQNETRKTEFTNYYYFLFMFFIKIEMKANEMVKCYSVTL